jgi:hypothetical protein
VRKDVAIAAGLGGAPGTVTRNFLDLAIAQGMTDTDCSRLYERFDEIVAEVGNNSS